MIGATIKGIYALLKGLGVTVKIFFSRPVTMQYPEVKRTPYLRYRGCPSLRLDEKGKDRCVACSLCATVCPAQVITIEAGEGNEYERFPITFEVDMGRCIGCGFCMEACPKGAIVMSRAYELAEYRREDLLYSKERLIKAGK